MRSTSDPKEGGGGGGEAPCVSLEWFRCASLVPIRLVPGASGQKAYVVRMGFDRFRGGLDKIFGGFNRIAGAFDQIWAGSSKLGLPWFGPDWAGSRES